ncbi:MAG: Triosephosphate isomerase [Candidatus Daviesbacteria bacterium GW2011_GWA2_38_24]|uniref:Triosephosphate isomerase n=1 Tax=Candidatus Daviesbacteria bacterium GW2011_GWA2_38_24 TaxID=1618422 RepID=A0A0G0M1D9_9BACT|nr:MAG: Triosephosphate isomerase [Candidatus Daviesbacteria bacterium GW2011_GWA2_38_24]KKQ79204.1 MAG: Triosephosphate isomerase [Candidatus Daviesbacteria bacterium GW2011_GWA1_38_7]
MEKPFLFVANFKSRQPIEKAIEWVEIVGPKLSSKSHTKVVVCPSFSSLEGVKKVTLVNNFPIAVGCQDVSAFPSGAYTGEEAAENLKTFVEFSIIGHSERRQNNGETYQVLKEKVIRAKDQNIEVIFCVQGEDTQIPDGVKIAAYEPVFAIGTGNPDTPENANNIAKTLKKKYGETLQVLYGGSVNSQNVKSFYKQEAINGVLIGSASLDAEEFVRIVQNCN